MNIPRRLYHGGPPDLKPGDLLTPDPDRVSHLLDNCPTCQARRAGTPLPDDTNDPTRIYVTSSRQYARLYAAGYPDGDLYQVTCDPGTMTPTSLDEDAEPSWSVPEARIIAVLERFVRPTDKELRRWIKQWL